MSRLLSQRTLALLLICLLAAAGNAYAQTTWYVDDDAPGDPNAGDPTVSDPNEDGSATHPFDAIQEGIDAAVNGDTVLVLDGEYTGVGNYDLDFGGRLITVQSANGAAGCVIDCEWMGRGFYFDSGESAAAVVEGFTITNGNADVGGGMYSADSSPTVTRCTFSGNTVGHWGGGMCNENSSPTVTHCTFSGNTTVYYGGGMLNKGSSTPIVTHCTFNGNTADEHGGGMYNWQSTPTVTHCMFSDNDAQDGGGMYNYYSSPKVTQCTFTGNSTVYQGGGMYNWQTSPTVTRCTFSGNDGLVGGGMYNNDSSPKVTQCTFNGNTAGLGSGMYNAEGSTPTVTHCTFSWNTAGGGGGMFNGASSPTVTNSILWNDTPDEICSVNSSPVVTYSDVQDDDPNDGTIYPGTGNIDDDPLFVDPDGPDNDPNTWDDNDYHLASDSPCINAGDNAAAVVFTDTTTDTGTQTSVTVADPNRYTIDDEIEYDGDGVLRTVTAVDPNSGQVSFDDPLAAASEPNAPIANYGWGDIDGDDRIFDYTVDMGADEFTPPQLTTTEPPADGTLPKMQNNIIVCTFDAPIALPPSGEPLVITELADPNNDVSSSFSYSVDPNDTGDPTGATLKATENGAVLPDQTWYHVSSAPGWTDVLPFEFDLCVLHGDAYLSGRVTTSDYSMVKAHLGERDTDARYDLNGSGRVTVADYSVVKATLGNRAPAKP